MHAAVVWADRCHLLPPNAHFDILALEASRHVSQVIFDPLILQVKFVELGARARDPLVPNDDGILLASVGLVLADQRKENNVRVPVEQVRDIRLQVKIERGRVLFVVFVRKERIHFLHLEGGRLDLVSVIELAVEKVQQAHCRHAVHHVV